MFFAIACLAHLSRLCPPPLILDLSGHHSCTRQDVSFGGGLVTSSGTRIVGAVIETGHQGTFILLGPFTSSISVSISKAFRRFVLTETTVNSFRPVDPEEVKVNSCEVVHDWSRIIILLKCVFLKMADFPVSFWLPSASGHEEASQVSPSTNLAEVRPPPLPPFVEPSLACPPSGSVFLCVCDCHRNLIGALGT